MIVFTCPRCNHDLEHITVCTYPPTDVFTCKNCGFKDEVEQEVKKIKYEFHPFISTLTQTRTEDSSSYDAWESKKSVFITSNDTLTI